MERMTATPRQPRGQLIPLFSEPPRATRRPFQAILNQRALDTILETRLHRQTAQHRAEINSYLAQIDALTTEVAALAVALADATKGHHAHR